MTSPPGQSSATAPRRRWFQFSLRTLLVLMLMFGGVFSWMGLHVHRSIEQRQALTAIRELGGSVQFAQPSSFIQRREWLRELIGDEAALDVEGINVGFSPDMGDAGLVHLRGLMQLQHLDLEGTHVSDVGLVHLRGLMQLQHLDLEGTHVSDVGLVHLRGLTQLQVLDLVGTQVTDAGVAELQKALPTTAIIRLAPPPSSSIPE